MFIKEKILLDNKNKNIKINISSNSNLNGLQDSIVNFIEKETGLSINPAIDGETFRFKNSLSGKTFNFKFHSGNTYSNSLLFAGFTSDDFKTSSYDGSFFIMQVYDSIITETQVLLHSSFFNGFNFSGLTTTYNILNTSEFSNLYIEQNFLNSTTANTINVYAKFFFFNAKLGKIHTFYNETNELLTTEEKLFHEIIINKANREYTFSTPTTILLKEFTNEQYNQQINSTLEMFSVEKPTYPTGTIFTNEGTYQ